MEQYHKRIEAVESIVAPVMEMYRKQIEDTLNAMVKRSSKRFDNHPLPDMMMECCILFEQTFKEELNTILQAHQEAVFNTPPGEFSIKYRFLNSRLLAFKKNIYDIWYQACLKAKKRDELSDYDEYHKALIEGYLDKVDKNALLIKPLESWISYFRQFKPHDIYENQQSDFLLKLYACLTRCYVWAAENLNVSVDRKVLFWESVEEKLLNIITGNPHDYVLIQTLILESLQYRFELTGHKAYLRRLIRQGLDLYHLHRSEDRLKAFELLSLLLTASRTFDLAVGHKNKLTPLTTSLANHAQKALEKLDQSSLSKAQKGLDLQLSHLSSIGLFKPSGNQNVFDTGAAFHTRSNCV